MLEDRAEVDCAADVPPMPFYQPPAAPRRVEIETIVARLKTLMDQRGMRAATLSTSANLSAGAVRDILRGRSLNPGVLTLDRLAASLGLPVEALIYDETKRLENAVAATASGVSDLLRASATIEEIEGASTFAATLNYATVTEPVAGLWLAWRCVRVMIDGEPIVEPAAFTRQGIAEACWPESLAKALDDRDRRLDGALALQPEDAPGRGMTLDCDTCGATFDQWAPGAVFRAGDGFDQALCPSCADDAGEE